MDTREALVALNLLEGIGPVRVRQLIEIFGDAAKVLQANRSTLVRVKGIGDDLAGTIMNWESATDLAGELKSAEDLACGSFFKMMKSTLSCSARFTIRLSCFT